MADRSKLAFFGQLFSRASERRPLIMKSRRRRKLQSYRKKLEYVRKQHSRARANLLVLLSVLSQLYAPTVRICWANSRKFRVILEAVGLGLFINV